MFTLVGSDQQIIVAAGTPTCHPEMILNEKIRAIQMQGMRTYPCLSLSSVDTTKVVHMFMLVGSSSQQIIVTAESPTSHPEMALDEKIRAIQM